MRVVVYVDIMLLMLLELLPLYGARGAHLPIRRFHFHVVCRCRHAIIAAIRYAYATCRFRFSS